MKRIDAVLRPRRVIERKFAAIYADDFWTNGSGPGSTEELTGEYRAYLQKFLHTHAITRVVDVGCGDWQFSRLIDWRGMHYTGFDIVPSVIEANTARFASDSIRFVCGDVRHVKAPPADLAIIKDVLQHLSNESVASVLRRVKHVKYLLVTNDCVENVDRTNSDTADGGWRPLRLDYGPFNLTGTTVLEFPSVPHRKATLLHVQSL